MIVNVRNQNGELKAKDILDIPIDMSVVKRPGEKNYRVKVSKNYYLDDEFEDVESAEHALKLISDARNQLEEDLRMYS